MMVRCLKARGEMLNDTDYLEGEDWISNLPDPILCHILSFIPTRNAVQTGILSTRWKSLWTSVPTIDFHNYGPSREDNPGCFMDQVDRVLLLNSSSTLNRFLLHNEGVTMNPIRFNSWISTAIDRHVQELDLQITIESIIELPCNLFVSIDLVVLKLRCRQFCWTPLTVFLPHLKVLHLCFVEFIDDDLLNILLSGCPVLEEFEIVISSTRKTNTFCISSSTLKKLLVHNRSRPSGVQRGVMIKAPSLETLELHGEPYRVFVVDELLALVKANFRVCFHSDNDEDMDFYGNAVVRMLAKAPNVQHLSFDNRTLKDLVRAPAYNQLSFHSLTHLAIGIFYIPCSVVLDLLRRIPSLTVLVLNMNKKCCDEFLWSAVPENVPENVPICLPHSLEKIEFLEFYGCNKEMKLLQYLLESATVLKKLTLHSWSINKRIKTYLEKYLKGSSTCQIEMKLLQFLEGDETIVASSFGECHGFEEVDSSFLDKE